MEGVFIRAPRITRVGDGVEVLGTWREDPVVVRQGRILGATFHPELTADHRVHELFLRIAEDENV
jgi:5'-phosphate synthase pdxT subunit